MEKQEPRPRRGRRATSAVVYGLCDPRDNRIRYIGVTENPVERLRNHLLNKKERASRKGKWVDGLIADGLQPRMVLLAVVALECANEEELRWIRRYRENEPDLLNEQVGGNYGKRYAINGRLSILSEPRFTVLQSWARLAIVAELSEHGVLTVSQITLQLNITHGNTSTHLPRLEAAGLITRQRHDENGDTFTTVTLTELGRQTWQDYRTAIASLPEGT